MKKTDVLREIGIDLFLTAVLYLFYRTFWVLLALPVIALIYHKVNSREIKERNKAELNRQFKDALISLAAALRAGYSMENAIRESLYEMSSVYGNESFICKELNNCLSEIELGVSIEKAISGMALRTGVEDIKIFAEVFQIAQRSGGDMVEIIRKTANDISSKIETQNEIAVLVSSKRMEAKIMLCMPIGIILYISVASPSLIEPLYGNALGVLIMTICLGIYVFAYYLSLKMVKINI